MFAVLYFYNFWLKLPELSESAILLFLGIGLIALAFAARRIRNRNTKGNKNLTEIHLSEHGGV